MAGIVKGIAFTVDRAAIKKMQQHVEWTGNDLYEIAVKEDGTVSIDSAVVFATKYAQSMRELELRELQEAIDRLKSENPVR